ncbi:MAG: hypothetical protein H3Z50_01665 [archaeon]|nr:hypothetical protein [archaeon]MCP8305583.1 hypothetical protein [archaeon]
MEISGGILTALGLGFIVFGAFKKENPERKPFNNNFTEALNILLNIYYYMFGRISIEGENEESISNNFWWNRQLNFIVQAG